MKSSRASTLVIAGVVGLAGLGAGAAIGPAVAATTGSSHASSGRVDAIEKALAGLVSDKTLTQAQADKVASTLAKDGPAGPSGAPGPGSWGGPWVGGGSGVFQDELKVAASAIGITSDQLTSALQSGKTLAQVAADHGVSEDTLVGALVDAQKSRIADAVKDGKLTQAQADTITSNLPTWVKAAVTGSWPGGHPGGAGGWHGWGGWGGWGNPSASPSSSAS